MNVLLYTLCGAGLGAGLGGAAPCLWAIFGNVQNPLAGLFPVMVGGVVLGGVIGGVIGCVIGLMVLEYRIYRKPEDPPPK